MVAESIWGRLELEGYLCVWSGVIGVIWISSRLNRRLERRVYGRVNNLRRVIATTPEPF
jgi:hypothetical protein